MLLRCFPAMSATEEADFSILDAPRIVLQSSHSNPKEVKRELRKRGFMVENHFVSNPHTQSKKYVLAMSEKLYIKLIVELDFPLVRYRNCLPTHRLLVVQAALDFIKRCPKTLMVEDVWIAHNEESYAKLFRSTNCTSWRERITAMFKYSSKVDEISAYFGPQIALYFAWMDHYTDNIIIPAIAGLLLFGHLWLTDSIDSIYTPFYAILISIWGTTFMEFWKGKCAQKAFSWGVLGVEDDEADLEMTKVRLPSSFFR